MLGKIVVFVSISACFVAVYSVPDETKIYVTVSTTELVNITNYTTYELNTTTNDSGPGNVTTPTGTCCCGTGGLLDSDVAALNSIFNLLTALLILVPLLLVLLTLILGAGSNGGMINLSNILAALLAALGVTATNPAGIMKAIMDLLMGTISPDALNALLNQTLGLSNPPMNTTGSNPPATGGMDMSSCGGLVPCVVKLVGNILNALKL